MSLLPDTSPEVPSPTGHQPSNQAVILSFPRTAGAHRGIAIADDPHAARPDGQVSIDVFEHLAGLIDDPRTLLTQAQQDVAKIELAALVRDALGDARGEDPDYPRVALPGRAATAALRIILARGLIREEWDT